MQQVTSNVSLWTHSRSVSLPHYKNSDGVWKLPSPRYCCFSWRYCEHGFWCVANVAGNYWTMACHLDGWLLCWKVCTDVQHLIGTLLIYHMILLYSHLCTQQGSWCSVSSYSRQSGRSQIPTHVECRLFFCFFRRNNKSKDTVQWSDEDTGGSMRASLTKCPILVRLGRGQSVTFQLSLLALQ